MKFLSTLLCSVSAITLNSDPVTSSTGWPGPAHIYEYDDDAIYKVNRPLDEDIINT